MFVSKYPELMGFNIMLAAIGDLDDENINDMMKLFETIYELGMKRGREMHILESLMKEDEQ